MFLCVSLNEGRRKKEEGRRRFLDGDSEKACRPNTKRMTLRRVRVLKKTVSIN
jgi:hypothetical protein